MEVILLEQIKNLGDLGDTVKVRAGYGRNFLVPKGIALPANDANRKVFEERKAELMKKADESRNAAKLRADQINGRTLTITARTHEEDKLYGSIGPNDIVDAAAKDGLELAKAEIDMPEGPIRVVGSYELDVELHSDVMAKLTVVVAAENPITADTAAG